MNKIDSFSWRPPTARHVYVAWRRSLLQNNTDHGTLIQISKINGSFCAEFSTLVSFVDFVVRSAMLERKPGRFHEVTVHVCERAWLCEQMSDGLRLWPL